MSNDEYRELIDFLGKKFGRVDQRFEQIDQRFERMDERLVRVEVLGEQTRSELRLVAEGVTAVSGRLERFQAEVDDRFRDLRDEMHTGFAVVHGRIDDLGASLREEMRAGFAALAGRDDALEGRIERLETERR